MKEEEFNLSEKIGYFDDKQIDEKLLVKDVKQKINDFIEELKEEGSHLCVEGKCKCYNNKIPEENAVLILKEDLNKLLIKHFGDKLIKEGK